MATTTNYGWTTPDDTALVKDGAAAIRTLGSSVDTTTKALNPETTLGDLAYRSSTANVKTRLGLGTAGQVLQVNSGANAPEWATPSSGGMTLISTTSLTGASVTLSSIPSIYKNLQIIVQNFRPATDNSQFCVEVNGDSAARYISYNFGGAATNPFNENFWQCSAGSDNGTSSGLISIELPDYTNATTWKSASSLAIINNNTTAANSTFSSYGHGYNQTAAVSSLKFFPYSGNFTSGSVLLYGVK
jgi:hypothetical protein